MRLEILVGPMKVLAMSTKGAEWSLATETGAVLMNTEAKSETLSWIPSQTGFESNVEEVYEVETTGRPKAVEQAIAVEDDVSGRLSLLS